MRYVGHVLRGESLEKQCLMGMIEGSRARGRQRIKYLDGIKTLVGVRNVGEVVRLAEDRGMAQHCRHRTSVRVVMKWS